MFYWFFDNLCLQYSDDARIWKEYETDPHNILTTYNLNTNTLNLIDLKLCYKYYLQAPPDVYKSIISTPVPENTKIFCHWFIENRECYEDMQIKPATYGDIFQEAFEINGKYKDVIINLIDGNKILFEFVKK